MQINYKEAKVNDVDFFCLTLECLFIFNSGDRFLKHLENTHFVKAQALIFAQGSYTNIDSYVANSKPLPTLPSYQNLNDISLKDWIEIIVARAISGGTCNKTRDPMNAQVQEENVPSFFNKLREAMTGNQLMNIKEDMENDKGICIDKPSTYKISDLYDILKKLINGSSHMFAVASVFPLTARENHGLCLEGSLRRSAEIVKNAIGKAPIIIIDTAGHERT